MFPDGNSPGPEGEDLGTRVGARHQARAGYRRTTSRTHSLPSKRKRRLVQYETAFYAQLCADRVRSARGQRVVADQERAEEVLATEVVALTLSGADEAAAGNVALYHFRVPVILRTHLADLH